MNDLPISYKIVPLYLLGMSKIPLTNAQISEFMTAAHITEYLPAQEIIGFLADTGLIDVIKTSQNTSYVINKKGEDTLKLFPEKIPQSVKDDAKAFFDRNCLSISDHSFCLSDYTPAPQGGYLVNVKNLDGDLKVLDITIHVPTKDAAIAICDGWEKNSGLVHQLLLEKLL